MKLLWLVALVPVLAGCAKAPAARQTGRTQPLSIFPTPPAGPQDAAHAREKRPGRFRA